MTARYLFGGGCSPTLKKVRKQKLTSEIKYKKFGDKNNLEIDPKWD